MPAAASAGPVASITPVVPRPCRLTDSAACAADHHYVPWFAIVAAGVFAFSTTWRSEACWLEAIIVKMANGTVEGPKKPKSAAQAAQEKGLKKFKEADGAP